MLARVQDPFTPRTNSLKREPCSRPIRFSGPNWTDLDLEQHDHEEINAFFLILHTNMSLLHSTRKKSFEDARRSDCHKIAISARFPPRTGATSKSNVILGLLSDLSAPAVQNSAGKPVNAGTLLEHIFPEGLETQKDAVSTVKHFLAFSKAWPKQRFKNVQNTFFCISVSTVLSTCPSTLFGASRPSALAPQTKRRTDEPSWNLLRLKLVSQIKIRNAF